MRETAPTAPTAEEPSKAERDLAYELERTADRNGIAYALAEARKAGHAAGLAEGRQLGREEAADDAHAAGYAEGLEAAHRSAGIAEVDAYLDGLGNR